MKGKIILAVVVLVIGMMIFPSSQALFDKRLSEEMNNPPSIPIISGPGNGVVGVDYTYSFVSEDPDGDDIFYAIVWKPGSVVTYDGPYESGEEIHKSHTWDEKEIYTICAIVKDIHDATSDRGTLEVNIGNILYVDDDNTMSPWDGTIEHPYQFIQDGINNASDGDIIFVYNGTYYEHLNINKKIDITGEDPENTIIDGGHISDVVRIYSSYVTFKGFTIKNSGQGMWDSGIEISYDNHVHIINCIVTSNNGGIQFNSCHNSSITNSKIHNNSWNSIIVYDKSDNITIKNCTIDNNGIDGHPGGIVISGRTSEILCSNITITGCTIYCNWYEGILISRSKNVELSYNNIYKNTEFGIFISETGGPSYDIGIFNNSIIDNGDGQIWSGGIYLQDCSNLVTVKNNDIKSNNKCGIRLLRSSCNKIYNNNFIDNICNAFFEEGALFNYWDKNYWDRPRILPKPIFGFIRINDKIVIPWVQLDWHPARTPYEI